MKKLFKYMAMSVLGMAALACSKNEDIVFDHEKQAFETKENLILVEAILPQATSADDVVYIAGAFNGDTLACGKPEYQLERSATIPQKWGIYLDPSEFIDGKTLADGFTFYCEAQGWERSPLNKPVVHTLNISAGQWANVYVDKWEKYFENETEEPVVEHDGPAIFIQNKTSWTAIALYAWGDAEAFGGWPGIQPTGTQKIDGVEWTYFDAGEANRGKTEHLIFNNNNGGSQLKDFDVVLDRDYYLILTDEGVTEYVMEEKLPKHDGFYRVYAKDESGWDALALYLYGDVNNLGGGWPGIQPGGKHTYKGVEYTYFDISESEASGKAEHLIFNNNNGGKQVEFGTAITFGEQKDYFFTVTASEVKALDPDNASAPSEPTVEPETPVVEGTVTSIYVSDNTGWSTTNLYGWATGQTEVFGAWPGKAPVEKVTFSGKPYNRYEVAKEFYGKTYNLIFNGGGTQIEGLALTFDRNQFVNLSDKATVAEGVTPRIYVSNNAGWENVKLYSWGDDLEVFGKWNGSSPAGKETVDGVEYIYFNVPAEFLWVKANLIFNNGLSDEATKKQLDGPQGIVLNKDYFINLTATEAKTIK